MSEIHSNIKHNKDNLNYSSSFQLFNENSPLVFEYNSKKSFIRYIKNNFLKSKYIYFFIKKLCYSYSFLLILYILILVYFYKISKIAKYTEKIKVNKEKQNFNSSLSIKSKSDIKVCVCTLGKEENRYIREFVKHYHNYDIDTIFLYDNNEINGENFEEVIKDYIDMGFVKIVDWRGKNKSMIRVWNDCYLNNYDYYDWLIFYDIDEYIYLKNYTSIKAFLSEPRFQKCPKIYLNWVIHTDNNLINYDNRTLHERFPEVEINAKKKNNNSYGSVKTILKGHIPNVRITRMHIFSRDIKGCNGFGEIAELNSNDHIKNPDYEYYYIDHYYSKSIEEFVEKINKGDVYFDDKTSFKMHRVKRYFNINKITMKKIIYIEKYTGLDLKKYKKQLIKEHL